MRNRSRSFILLLAAVYTVSYITRINYSAVISEIGTDTGISKGLLSLAPTGSFIAYGLGQIFSGMIGDRFSTKKIIAAGLLTTTVMNLLLPLCRGPYQMLAVWSVNGLAQALLWPPLVKTAAVCSAPDEYGRNMVRVAFGSALGTMIVYLLSPIIISAAGWRAVFLFAALCGLGMLLVWIRSGCNVEPESGPKTRRPGTSVRLLFAPVMIAAMAAIVIQGMLRDGVMTWMPSYLAETYHLTNSAAILSGVLLPLFSLLCCRLTESLHRRFLPDPLAGAGVLVGAGALAAGILFGFSRAGAASAVLSMACLSGCAHGVNFLLISLLPSFFKRSGNISTVSGVLNACTYAGSALSVYGTAFLTERSGWESSVLLWLLLCLAGTILCLLAAPAWKKQMEQSGP